MSIGMVEKTTFEALKATEKNSIDTQEMIKNVEKFENVLNEAMHKKVYEKLERDDKTPLFSAKTVDAIKKAKEMENAVQQNQILESYEDER